MRSVDERVVEMRFDNKDFESGVRESMSTLSRFESSLDELGSTRGIDGINRSISNISFTPLQNGLAAAGRGFSALETIAVGALMRIGGKITDYVGNQLNQLTIAPVKQGFDEYELKMGAVQTIMASTGEDLSVVNKYLEELNQYADKTIYSFSDMTQNIGKFTNNGVKLKDAVSAIQGISNAAAVAGANSNEASRAMYNFSQALSQGSVKLIDWKSIQNANMATTDFKQNLIDTAVAMGTLVKEGNQYVSTTTDLNGKVSQAFDANKMFNESLSASWMTTEVLVQTLQNYSTDVRDMSEAEKAEYETKLKSIGYTEDQIKTIEELGIKAFDAAQDVKTFSQLLDTLKEAVGSGWAQTFELIFGNFEEAKSLWSGVNKAVSPIIDKIADSRNTMLKEWREGGGREALIEGFGEAFQNLKSILESIKGVWDAVFPTEKFYILEKAIDGPNGLTTGVGKAAKVMIDLSKKFRSFAKSIKPSKETLDKIKDTFRGLFSLMNMGKKTIKALFDAFKPSGDTLKKVASNILDITASIGRFLTEMDRGFTPEGSFGSFFKTIESIGTELKRFVEGLFDFKDEVADWGTDLGGIFAMVFNHLILSPVETVARIVARLLGKEGDDISGFANKIIKPLQTVRDTIYELIEKFRDLKFKMPDLSPISDFIDRTKEKFHPLQTVWDWLKKFAEGVSEILEPLVDILAKIAKRIGGAIDGVINGLLDMLADGDFEEIIKLVQGGSLALVSANLVQFSASMNEVAEGAAAGGSFLTSFFNSLKDPKKLMADATESIEGFIQALNPIQKEGGGSGIKEIADTIFTLVKSLFVLALIDTNKLDDSILAITGLFADLVGSMKLMSGLEMTVRGVRSLAIALGVMGYVAYQLARLPREDAMAGVSMVAGLLLSLVLPFKAFEKVKTEKVAINMLAASAALAIVANSMQPLGNALYQLSAVDPLKDVMALLTLAGGVFVLVKALQMLEKVNPGYMLAAAVSLGIIAVAMKPLSEALVALSAIGLERVFTSLLIMAGGILILVKAIDHLQDVKVGKMLATVLALTVLSTAMVAMAVSFKIVSTIGWQGLAVSLLAFAGAMGSFLVMVDVMKSSAGRMIGVAVALGILATALIGMSIAFSIISGIGFSGMATGLAAFVGIMAIFMGLVTVIKTSAGRMAGVAASLLILAAAMTVMSVAFFTMSKVGWEGILSSLVAFGGTMAIFMGLVTVMSTSAGHMAGAAAALLILSAAMTQMAIAFMLFKFVDVGSIIKGLITLVGTIAVLGVAAGLMQGLIGTMVGLGAAMSLVGAGLVLIGLGITSIALGIASIGALTDAAIIEAMGYVELLIVGTLNIIAHSAEAFADAFVSIVVSAAKLILQFFASPELIEMMLTALNTIVTALVRYAPTIIDGILTVIDELVKGLAEHLPIIAGYIVDYVINMINMVAEKIPIFVDAVVNLIRTFIDTVINTLNGLDMENLKNGIIAYGMMSIFMGGLAGAAALAPMAMVGVLAVGAVIAEMSLVLAAIGGLYKIPGLAQFAQDGGELLRIVGEAIGKFLGGIAGGIAEGVMSALPQMGTYMSEFMANIQPFIDGASSIDPAAMDGVASLVKVMMLLTAAELLDQIVGWIAGDSGSALVDLGEELVQFAPKLKEFAERVKDVNVEQVKGAADATLTLAEMASKIPNAGGLLGMITGENSLREFGSELVMYAPNLIRFARLINESGTDISRESVQGVAEATIALAEMASQIPNSGGLLAMVTGENSLSAFGSELALYGPKLKEFANSVSGVTAEQLEGAIAASLSLVDMASKIPNTGGLLALVTGDNSLSKFGNEMANFGVYLSYFSDNVKEVNTEQVTKAAEATEELVNIASLVPNSGGLLASVTGDNSLSAFGKELVPYGKNLSKFSDEVRNINVDMVTGAITATDELIKMATGVTNGSGGIASIINGSNSLTDFGKELKAYAPSLTDFAGQVSGKVSKTAVQGAVDATIALGDMTEHLPRQDGWVNKILGVNSVKDFGEELASYGGNLATFASAVNGKVTNEMVQGAADATITLAKMAKDIPNTGGLVAKITGDNSLSTFGAELAPYGESLKVFASNVKDLSKDDVTGAATASTELIKMAKQVPNEGGLVAKITGENSLAAFGAELKDYGGSLKSFANDVEGVTLDQVQGAVDATIATVSIGSNIPSDAISKMIGIATFGEEINDFGRPFAKFADRVKDIPINFSTTCYEIATAVGSLVNGLPEVDKNFDLELLGDNLKSFGRDFNKFYSRIADVDPAKLTAVVDGLNAISKISKDISNINGKGLVQLANGMSDISTEGVTGFVSSFTSSAGSVKDSAAGMVSGAIDGILSMGHSLFTVVSSIGTGIVNTFQQSIPYQIFKSITENQFILAIIAAINGKRGQVVSAVSTVASDIVTQLRNNLNSGTIFNLGLMIPKGLSDGMLAGLPQLNATASRMGQIVSDAIRNRLKIQSPSKETYEDGAYVILGAINGMEAYADRLKTTTEDITEQSMLDPIREAIASVNDDGTINSETQPVIRPVLDLSEIQNGYKQINSLFDEQYRVDMQARMGRMETSSAINPEQIDQIEDAIRSINNDDVINEMETLRNDISNLKDAMTRLQVVMNSGTLVGELVDPMDAALGMKALQNSRGRY